MSAAESEPVPHPLADATLTQDLTTLIQQSIHYAQLKKGANEATRAVKRGTAELAVLAADTAPLALLAHVPELCEQMNVPYVYVGSKTALGRACGVGRPIVAAVVVVVTREESELMGMVREVRERVERLMI